MKMWHEDIAEIHTKHGFNESVRNLSPEMIKEYLIFRQNFLKEELEEGYKAIEENNFDDMVDSLVDLVYVAIGSLNVFDIDPQLAWDRVHKANMAKNKGIKSTRPNPFGLPDLIKPEGWIAPSHKDNIGLLEKIK